MQIFDTLPPKAPRRNTPRAQKIARYLLAKSGWKIVGKMPDVPNLVVIGAPHTSNMDGVWAILMVLALDWDLRILGKKQLFCVPLLGRFLYWSGVRPLDRKKGGALQTSLDMLKQHQSHLALAPEGTRAHTEGFRTGFYHLAHGAGVPIMPINIHYNKKQLQFLAPIIPTGDINADMPKIYAHFGDVSARHQTRICTMLAQNTPNHATIIKKQ